MNLSDFDYEYPEELGAQHPLEDRGASRLLALDRATGKRLHGTFADLPSYFTAGDVLVLNESRVINARLFGTRDNGRQAEVLLVHPEPEGEWLAMVHPGGKLKVGRTVRFGDEAVLRVTGIVGGGLRKLQLEGGLSWNQLMEQYGSVPLPPYIQRHPDPDDRERYQTVFARAHGSVAAPTAGLHFTERLLSDIRGQGIEVVHIVLHVGPGTFKPVQVADFSRHQMHAEWYAVPEGTAEIIDAARGQGRRIWAVGTTVTRVLETVGRDGAIRAGTGWTDLFIRPPCDFRVVRGLITNFHLPRSTLLMLVCAFGGYENVMRAYREAVERRYRLFSYGDAMVIA
jgi:S-adenosylmethionine:tRNA ribosyltransferase-isomerase